MAVKTEFDQFIVEEAKKYQGIGTPVKAGFLERLLVRKAGTGRLHPNPDDEFCNPEVGPNNKIIGDYIYMIRQYGSLQPDSWMEPIIVEKIRPEGYMILNGHHRWAAAIRVGLNPVPIKIVNLTQETDIEKMIRESKHDRRVTLDLDEVVFCRDEDDLADPPLPFPYNRLYNVRIRRGVPALLHFLAKEGYDIWVYSAKYYSIDSVRSVFRHYSVKVDGIITGTARKEKNLDEMKKRTEELFRNQYAETLHIERDNVLRTLRDTKTYEDFPVEAEPADWSRTVMGIVKKLQKDETK